MITTRDGYLIPESEEENEQALIHNTKLDVEKEKIMTTEEKHFFLKQKDILAKSSLLSSEDFIFDESSLPQRINHAIGKISYNGTQIRYFGAKLHRPEHAKEKNDQVIKIKEFECIILESGAIFTEKHRPKDLSFEFETRMTLKKNRWSNASIQEFMKKDLDVTYQKAYESFLKLYQENLVFEEQATYKFNALWDLLTYHQDLIDKSIIIKKEGVSGSAKSKAMRLSSHLAFNGRKWVRPTPANFFRYRNHNKATIYIEEAERLFDDSKNKVKGDDELVEYLNASYEKGNFVPRQNDKDINQTDEFDPFGFTQIGSIKPLKGALEKRSLTQVMIKAPKGDLRGDTEIGSEFSKEYIPARNQAYISSLKHYKEFETTLQNIRNDYSFANREWLIAKPILALAECISVDLKKEIAGYLQKHFIIRDDLLDETSWHIILAKELIRITAKKDYDGFVSNEDLRTNLLQDEHIGQYTKISTQTITNLMSQLGFKDYKGRNSDRTARGYERLSFQKVVEILVRNTILNIIDIKNILSVLSDCPYSEEEIEKIISDKTQTNDKDICPKSEEGNITDKRDKWTKREDPPKRIKELLEVALDKHKKGLNLALFEANIKDKGLSLEELNKVISEGKEKGEYLEEPSGILRRLE